MQHETCFMALKDLNRGDGGPGKVLYILKN